MALHCKKKKVMYFSAATIEYGWHVDKTRQPASAPELARTKEGEVMFQFFKKIKIPKKHIGYNF